MGCVFLILLDFYLMSGAVGVGLSPAKPGGIQFILLNPFHFYATFFLEKVA